MSGIYGFTGQAGHPGIAAGMASSLRINSVATSHALSSEQITIGAVGLNNQGAVFKDGDLTIAVFSTHSLGFPRRGSANAAQLLAEGYKEQGESLLSKLKGGFALAIADARHGSVLLAIDKMGICPLAWIVAVVIAALNAWLLYLVFTGI